jgi:hypothetical protein
MSKRRNRKQSPNLPPEMLERARQQLAQQEGGSDDAVEEVNVAAPAQPEPKVEVVKSPEVRLATAKSAAANARARSSRRGGLQPAQSRGERKTDQTDTKYVRSRLANPTRFVTQDQLREEYSYVVHDLRTMGILAVVLLIAMIVIEKLLA